VLTHNVRDEICLVIVGAIQLRAVDGDEARVQSEMLQDRAREHVRLGGGNNQPAAGGCECGERVGNP
jgi:hypothetical protein